MKPPPLPADYEGFVADALHDAMRLRDVPRVIEIGRLAAALVEIDIERERRSGTAAQVAQASKGTTQRNPGLRR